MVAANYLSDLKVDTSKPVLVTGATGYVAGVLIKDLLDAGCTVHAAVRDPSKKDRVQHLQDLANNTNKGSIKFFEGDLLDEGSYAEGMKGCSVVFHTASPFFINVKDPQKELVEPAVRGTKNVLNEATKCPTVKRVVLTSSVVAIFTDAQDTYSAPNEVLTEEIWNTHATLDYQPYMLSKTLAEQAAWVIAGSQTQWSLAVINPGFVMGPGIKYHATSESFTVAKSLIDGQMASGAPALCMGVVDVRDVAQAHVTAAFKGEDVKGRHILVGQNTNLLEMAQAAREKYPEYPLPSRKVPKILAWLVAPYIGLTRKYISRNVDVPVCLDNTKSIMELGIKYRPLTETMQDMLAQLIEEGVVAKK